ncbi:MBL fold metallo-hydrolase [Blastococcus deserti]|uniref:Rhodanese-like domain-containing protein n=1 Tax=Blastococcus deserti TaxID=2259033 RepID=A0ABW4X8N6_9ACTN
MSSVDHGVEAVTVTIDVTPLVDEGLGNSAYLVDLGDGRGLVVDASRDLRAVRAAAERQGLDVAYAVDTHLHADFLTGALQLAADDGAQVIASARGHRQFPHVGLDDGDEVDLGGLRLRALFTPGHTDEHLAYLLLDGQIPVGVFSGGSLIVGSAARTDLLGADRTDELARAQYRSLHRLATLADDVAVWPTHGAGSFCSAPAGARRTTTIGAEKAGNPLLAAPDEDAFVATLLGSLGSYPDYFSRLAELNRRGPGVLDAESTGRLTPLPVPAVDRLRDSGAVVVDVRPVPDFSAGHVPGALSIPLRPQFATWLGWLVPPGTPLVVVRNPDQDPGEVAWQARKVGYDELAGELAGGMDAWREAGSPIRSVPLVTAEQLPDISADEPEILDVRQDSEFRSGHVPGARHVELGALAHRADRLPDRPTVVMCGHGERAMGAASLLARAGRSQVSVLAGGPQDWSTATARPLVTGG